MKFNNVFVVDDDKIFHFIIKKLLVSNNINVEPRFFENGLQAIEGIKSNLENEQAAPDLILLDINMPVLDGWQFLEEFKLLKNRIQKEITIQIQLFIGLNIMIIMVMKYISVLITVIF